MLITNYDFDLTKIISFITLHLFPNNQHFWEVALVSFQCNNCATADPAPHHSVPDCFGWDDMWGVVNICCLSATPLQGTEATDDRKIFKSHVESGTPEAQRS